MPDNKKRLKELEQEWQARFVQQPKLPSGAMLLAVLSLACGFGAGMFFMFAQFRRHAWIWVVLSLAFGIANRILSGRWKTFVEKWGRERKNVAKEIEELRSQR